MAGKVRMEAANAQLTFPGLDNPLEDQDECIGHVLDLFTHVAAKVADHLIGGIWVDLVKAAVGFINNMSSEEKDKFNAFIGKYHLQTFCQDYSAEMNEIKFRLESVKNSGESDRTRSQLDYCVGRCGVLLNKFKNNLDHALVLTASFTELFNVYIAIGLAIIALERTHSCAAEMKKRILDIEEAAVAFKENAVRQRVEFVRRYKDMYSADWSYEDELRPDMAGVHINGEVFSSAGEERQEADEKRVEEYKEKLKSIYEDYFCMLNEKLFSTLMAVSVFHS